MNFNSIDYKWVLFFARLGMNMPLQIKRAIRENLQNKLEDFEVQNLAGVLELYEDN